MPLIWVVPLIALAVGGWMVWREIRERGPEITIEFEDGSGVEADKTKLEYRGVPIGHVTHVELAEDLKGVTVRARLKQSAAGVARTDTLIWVARPEIGFSGVRGLDTLFSGARISVRPGTGPVTSRLRGIARPPPEENLAEGRAFVLQSDRLNSLTPGAPVFYREIKVGLVETNWLADDASSVLVRIRVRTPFVNLVRTNSRFWVAGGASFKMGLLGAELKSTSLEAMLNGGVAFATPDGKLEPVAEDGTVFPLAREAEKDWEKWQPRIPIASPESAPDPESKVPALLSPSGT